MIMCCLYLNNSWVPNLKNHKDNINQIYGLITSDKFNSINITKYHVFAPMGRFQLELIYLYYPPSSHLVYLCFCPVGLQDRNINMLEGTTVENKGKLILTKFISN